MPEYVRYLTFITSFGGLYLFHSLLTSFLLQQDRPCIYKSLVYPGKKINHLGCGATLQGCPVVWQLWPLNKSACLAAVPLQWPLRLIAKSTFWKQVNSSIVSHPLSDTTFPAGPACPPFCLRQIHMNSAAIPYSRMHPFLWRFCWREIKSSVPVNSVYKNGIFRHCVQVQPVYEKV